MSRQNLPYLLLLLPLTALAALTPEKIARLTEVGKADQAWELCTEALGNGELTEAGLKEACAATRLGMIHGDREELDVLVDGWPGTSAARSAFEEAAGLLLEDASRREDYLEVFRTYPGTKAALTATQKAWALTQQEGTSVAAERFRTDFRGTPEAQAAQTLVLELAYNETEAVGTLAAWEALASRYPQHPRSEDIARKRLALGLVAARDAGPEALLDFVVAHPELPEGERLKAEAISQLIGASAALDATLRRVPLIPNQTVSLPWVPGAFDLELVDGAYAEVMIQEGNTFLPLSALAEAYQRAGSPVVPAVADVKSDTGWAETPYLCQPDGQRGLVLRVTVSEGKAKGQEVMFPFIVPETCAAQATAAREPVSVKAGGKLLKFGTPLADLITQIPKLVIDPMDPDRACMDTGGSSICVMASGGLVVSIEASCDMFDACYDDNSAYNRLGQEIVGQLPVAWTEQDASSRRKVLRRGVLSGEDYQYVGPESGDPAFSMFVVHEGLARLSPRRMVAPMVRRSVKILVGTTLSKEEALVSLGDSLRALGLVPDVTVMAPGALSGALGGTKPDLVVGEVANATALGLVQVEGTSFYVVRGSVGEVVARDLALSGCVAPYIPPGTPTEELIARAFAQEAPNFPNASLGFRVCSAQTDPAPLYTVQVGYEELDRLGIRSLRFGVLE